MTSTATEQITVIPYDGKTHYGMLREWWRFHGYPPPSSELLRHGGVALNDEGEPIVAYFIYFSMDVPVAHTQFVVSKPKNKPRATKDGALAIINFFEDMCKAGGYKVLLTHCPSRLTPYIEEAGFEIADYSAASCVKKMEGVELW
tara:strand:+ start:14681 stop:15115 length:435 start_codon:yes stop_codon:yes gene_type:complete